MVRDTSAVIIPPPIEWALPIEGVKLNFPQILEAEGFFLQGLTISPSIEFLFKQTMSTTLWEPPLFQPFASPSTIRRASTRAASP